MSADAPYLAAQVRAAMAAVQRAELGRISAQCSDRRVVEGMVGALGGLRAALNALEGRK